MLPCKVESTRDELFQGMRRRRYETVLVKLLGTNDAKVLRPRYVKLSSFACDGDIDELMNTLPDAARAYNNSAVEHAASTTIKKRTKSGETSKMRGRRKDEQVKSMLQCILALVSKLYDKGENVTIVDFGGGTGHMSIPLALLLPHCKIVCVDLSPTSIELLHKKAEMCVNSKSQQEFNGNFTNDKSNDIPIVTNSTVYYAQQIADCSTKSRQTAIPNLYTFLGPLQAYSNTFHVATALHLCGQATDIAMQIACRMSTCKAIVFAPCCVGKLNKDKLNPYTWQATGSNESTVSYPQSRNFCQCITSVDDWNVLAQAADFGEMEQAKSSRNATRRTCKSYIERDRCLMLQEWGYEAVLTRMQPWEASAKNDIIVAWKSDKDVLWELVLDDESMADMQATVDYLLGGGSTTIPDNGDYKANDATSTLATDKVDWTAAEENSIRETMLRFFIQDHKSSTNNDKSVEASAPTTFTFGPGLPSRLRKCVHYLADQYDLKHWGSGKRSSEKTVIVAIKKQGTVTW